MSSIYHFFHSLSSNRSQFKTTAKLENFPFNTELLSCSNVGKFPDLAIRINTQDELFRGGELIELKDSKSYAISSFNSTVPTGRKKIKKVITSENSTIKRQMEAAGDDIDSLRERDVFYLVRGLSGTLAKVVLVHGSFFETVQVNDLISGSFSQVLEERIHESGIEIDDDTKQAIIDVFSEQKSFSKTRHVDNASVKLRFRVMTEAKAEGNILNRRKYPEIEDNTLNLVLPCHDDEMEEILRLRFKTVFGEKAMTQFNIFKFKHHFNGYFLAFQQKI